MVSQFVTTIFLGDTPLYAARKGLVFVVIRSKTGIDFALFDLETVVLRELQERPTHLSFQFRMNQKERVIRKFEIDFFKKIVLLAF